MEKLTKALMTDETGQAIVTKLTALSGQMHELAMATRGSAILFESESDISVLGDGGYLAVYVGSTNPLVISGWTGDNSLVTGHLYYLVKSGTAVTSRDLGEFGGTAVTSTTFTEHGVPADDFAVGEALAEKADADDVTALETALESKADTSDLTALDTRVTAVEGDVGDLDSHIEKTNLIEGYLSGGVNASTIVASNNYLTVFFPVESGKAYTIDKKYATQYTRLGFTTELPVIGSTISNYENLGGGTTYKTFTAPQNGYACLYIWSNGDSSGATKEQVLAGAVAYEGQYNSDFVSEVNVIGFDNIEKIESDLEGYFPQTILKLSHFRVGTLYVTQGVLTQSSSNYRISNYKLYPLQMVVGDVIGLTDYSHYRYLLFYSADNSSWTQGSWVTEATTITAAGYYAIVVEDTNQTTQADASTMFNLIYYKDTSWINRVDARLTYLEDSKVSAKFAHLSFDDVQYCMIDLKNNANNYDSIFDNPFFAMLKNLHDVYGTVISLYLFLTNSEGGISAYPTKFANEFASNADWLKFGIHQGSTNYASTSAATALSDYEMFTSNIINIGGTVDIIDRCPRLGNFAGNLNSMLAMRDANGGIVGLLSAYDTRDSYYLDSTDSAYLFNHGKMVDAENHLTFFRTIKTFEVANPSTELPKLQTLAGMNGAPYGIIMMHEYGVYGSDFTLVDSMKARLEYACAWMVGHEYAWDYPMNRIF